MSELLAVGQTCTHPACSTVDFLPIKCQYCTQPYCSEHWKPQLHSCSKWDPSAHNRIAPACPFCQMPVAFAPRVDPDAAMEEHFEKKCDVVRGGGLIGVKGRGAVKREESLRCARKSCKKVLIAPITCQTCTQQFCAEHRFPASHTCKTATTSSTSLPPSSKSSSEHGVSNARAAAAIAAMNRAAAQIKPSSTQQPTASSSSPSLTTKLKSQPNPVAASSTSGPSLTNPFSKTERWDSSSSKSTVDRTAHPRSITPSLGSLSTSPTNTSNAFTTTPLPSSLSSSSSTASDSNSDSAQLTKPSAIIPQSRSRAEEESQKKALKERAKKGLLTEADKARLAQLNSKAGDGKDDNCIII